MSISCIDGQEQLQDSKWVQDAWENDFLNDY